MYIYLMTGIISYLGLKCYEGKKTGLFTYKKNYYQYLSVYFVALFLACIFGLRDISVGTDTKNYYYLFNWFGSKITKEKLIFENGFCFYTILINKFFGNFSIYLLLTGLLIYGNIIISLCNLSKSPSKSIIIFFGLSFFAQSCNIMRQYIAMSFCLLAIVFLLKKNNIILFLLNVLIGFSFHKSAIIFLLIIFIYKIKFDKKFIITSFICSITLIIILPYLLKLFDYVFKSHYYMYLSDLKLNFSLNNIFTFLLIGFISILLILIKSKMKNLGYFSREYDFFAGMYFLFNCIFVISLFTISLFDRLSIYFMPSLFYLIPIIININYKNSGKLIWIAIVDLLIILVFISLIINNSYEFLPYRFIQIF